MMLAGLSSFAGNPETTKTLKPTYRMVPEPPRQLPEGYIYKCCGTIHWYNDDHTCLITFLECWGSCGIHYFTITCCADGSRTIEGSLVIANEPKTVEVPVTTAIAAEKYENLDPVTAAIEYKRVENSVVYFKNEMVMETETGIFIYAPGTYQILNSKMLVIATKTES